MTAAPTVSSVPASRSSLWALIRLVLFLGFAATIMVFVTGEADNQEIVAVLPLMCAAVALYLLPLFTARSLDLFSPTSWTGLKDGFELVVILVGIFFAGRIELGPLSELSSARRISLAQQAALLHLTARSAYLIGFSWPIMRSLARRLPNLTARSWRPSRVVWACVLLFAVFAITYAEFQSRLGGSLWDITRLREGKAVWREDATMTWMTRGVQIGFLPVIIIFMYASAVRSRSGLILAGGLFLFIAFLASRLGQRGPAVLVGAAMLMLFHYRWRKVPLVLFLGLLLVAMVTANVLGTFRSSGHVETTFDDEFATRISRPGEAMAEHATDRDRLTAQAAVLHYFPDKRDFLWGESWAPLPTMLIPKWIWAEKHGDDLWTDTRIVPRLIGVQAPVSFPTMLYANFSWVGVFVGMYLWGVFHHNLYAWHSAAKDPLTTLMYVLTLAVFSPAFLGISAALQYVVPMLVVIYFVTARAPSTHSTLMHSSRTRRD